MAIQGKKRVSTIHERLWNVEYFALKLLLPAMLSKGINNSLVNNLYIDLQTTCSLSSVVCRHQVVPSLTNTSIISGSKMKYTYTSEVQPKLRQFTKISLFEFIIDRL